MATIGFSTNWPEHMGAGPTYFIEKIWQSIVSKEGYNLALFKKGYEELYGEKFGKMWDGSELILRPKRHTIRKNKKGYWKEVMKLHPVVFNRTKNQFQFAPVLKIKSIQEVKIDWHYEDQPYLFVNDKVLNYDQIDALAVNDGFDSIEHFFEWFNKDFTGIIIHWTDLKY
jgi:uncharacterized C2H2 Zn-finger protein